MSRWALQLAREDAAALAPLRLEPALEVAEAGPALWLRGPAADPGLHHALLCLPAVTRFEWLADDRLRRVDRRIPEARLPQASWVPLAQWLEVGMPPAGTPGWDPRPVPLRLERSGEEAEPTLLGLSMAEWHRYAMSAPEIRLRPLRFAASRCNAAESSPTPPAKSPVNAAGRVFVQGRPLPPLPGRRYVVREGIAVPAGWAWRPAVTTEVLARRLGAGRETLVVWDEDGTFVRVGGEQFVAATRAAVRATAEALGLAGEGNQEA